MYGKTIKNIRSNKGLKQKDICQDIVTLSYYSRIEREISTPTIDVFLKILDNLNVSLEEFLFIHNNHKKKEDDIIWFEITELYHSGDINSLIEYRNILSQEKYKNENPLVLKRIIDLFIMRLNHKQTEIDLSPITNNLKKIEHWTSREVKIFISIMDMIPIELLIIIVNRLIKQKKLYAASDGYNSPYSKILINSILLCIDHFKINEAQKYLRSFNNILEVRDVYGKTMYLYLEGLINYVNGNKIEGTKNINNSFQIFKLVNMEEFSHKYKIYFEKIKKKTKYNLSSDNS